MPKIIEEFYGRLEFYDHHIVFTGKQGVDFAENEARNMLGHVSKQFKDRNFVYISNRTSDYSVNPLSTQQLIKATNVQSVAIVSNSGHRKKTLEIEKQFYREIPVRIFSELEPAIAWSLQQLEESPS